MDKYRVFSLRRIPVKVILLLQLLLPDCGTPIEILSQYIEQQKKPE